MTDTAEYWSDVKNASSRRYMPAYVHLKDTDCGHYHKNDTNILRQVTCTACLHIISKDCDLSQKLVHEIALADSKRDRERRKKKGYKLLSIIKFGKYKGHQKTVQWIIDNDNSYFRWMQGRVLFHPEVDRFINQLK